MHLDNPHDLLAILTEHGPDDAVELVASVGVEVERIATEAGMRLENLGLDEEKRPSFHLVPNSGGEGCWASVGWEELRDSLEKHGADGAAGGICYAAAGSLLGLDK